MSDPQPQGPLKGPPVQGDSNTGPVKRLSDAVERTVEKTVDRLSKSVSGIATTSSSATSLPSPTHRRMFSLSRRNKASSFSQGPQGQEPLFIDTGAASPSNAPQRRKFDPRAKAGDDSPFISPPSPVRPALSPFRGSESMRLGTQTLIQALQAISRSQQDINESSDQSDEDDPESEERCGQLSSSIHTLYRPVARSRRRPRRKTLDSSQPLADEAGPEEPIDSEEGEDFENRLAPTMPTNESTAASVQPNQDPTNIYNYIRPPTARSGSLSTIKLQRRVRLAEKLRDVFELPGIEEVWAELPCWLLRSVLLQGYMYLTNAHLCFFAHMPCREDQVLKSGSLNKKAQRTKRWIKYWFVLRNDALSWYQSSSDPYFPHGIVDLRYALSCEPIGERDFRLRTNQKVVLLSADSIPSRDEWVKAIRKVIFKAQNSGDSVKIAIPYSLILDVERSSAMDFSETIEIKVFDKEEQYSVDSYFFAYFRDMSTALEQIRDAVRAYRAFPTVAHPQSVIDTTSSRSATTSSVIARSTSVPTESSSPKATTGFRLASLLKPFSLSLTSSPTVETEQDTEDFTHISKRTNSSSFIPVTSSPSQPEMPSASESPRFLEQNQTISDGLSSDHTYPPSTFPASVRPDQPSLSSEGNSAWSVGVPSWLKQPRSIFGGPSTTSTPPRSRFDTAGVREIYSPVSPTSTKLPGSDLAYSVLETPEATIDADTTEKFRAAFAFDEKESLLGYFPGYIFRLLPVFGRLYISTNYFCFRSTSALASRTRMALPIRDILAVEKSKATRFGHYGLVVVIKGHEELFFEFGSKDRRGAFVSLLERQIDDVRKRQASSETNPDLARRDGLILEEFEHRTAHDDADVSLTLPENMTDSLPAVMFTSASSTFLTFKPSNPLHFTFLTIGSRGDVQPYIALAKGLIADGHRCRIATHGEFQAWIESHGIEFGYVGGDPAELMRICIENGTFTVSFLKEGLLKFRGWVDDLLKTSWEACQGTDILVESPSAMAGYHIAEALRIPYFRAFTMAWTRTRVYPHAFAVPERKMGGSYNYMSYVMFDQVFWRGIAGQINRWRRDVLRLDSTSLDRMEPHTIPFLYNFSPHVVPPPLDWPEWIRVTGYWFLDDADVSAEKWTPPSDLVEFLDKARALNKRIVYIGFGSIVVSDPKSMTQCVVEAVIQSGVHAILSKGWSDRLYGKASDASEPEVALPPQIYPVTSIPHDWLFKRIDAACHHGGAGTTGASLRAGIPTIIKPFFGDQFFWADRVEALGVGCGIRKLTVPALAEALVTATVDAKQISRAKHLGEQIRAENGVATAIESIYRDLEYARSLIKYSPTELALQDGIDTKQTVASPDANNRFSTASSPSAESERRPSEEWSVISEQDDRRSSVSSRRSNSKRASLTTAVLSVLPDSFTPGPSRRRSTSISPKS